MMVVVSYDVSTTTQQGARRLRRIAKICEDYGLRVQYSVFECNLSPAHWEILKHKLLSTYNAKEDSLRFYYLGANWKKRIEHHGIRSVFNLEDPMII